MKRSRIRPVSARRAHTREDHAAVREQVFQRDGWRCRFPEVHRCYGNLTYHHILKASAGGSYTVDNGISLCAWANDWIEDHPDEAVRLGLVKRGKSLPEVTKEIQNAV